MGDTWYFIFDVVASKLRLPLHGIIYFTVIIFHRSEHQLIMESSVFGLFTNFEIWYSKIINTTMSGP